jgi:hypothetical protein
VPCGPPSERQPDRLLEEPLDLGEELGAVGAERMRWSQDRVISITFPGTISPSFTTGRSAISPTARMPAWGELTIASKLLIPYMPRFDTEKVPPESSGGVIDPSLTLPARARASAAISRRPLRSASKIVGTTSASSAATAMPTFTRE